MPNWKKVVTSGSNAVLNEITSSGGIYSAQDIYSRESKLGRDTYLERLITLGTEPSLDSTSDTSIHFLTRNTTSGEIERHSLGSNAFNSTAFTTCTGTVTGTGTDNQVMTSTGGTGIQGEANLTFNGSTLTVDSKANIGSSGNSLSGNYTSILGGYNQTIGSSAHCSTIAGGAANTVNGYLGFIGGGGTSTIEGNHSVIAGGCANYIKYCENFIGGGSFNTIGDTGTSLSHCADRRSVIVGGSANTICGGSAMGLGYCTGNFIGGGQSNTLRYSSCAVLVGGHSGCITGATYGFLGGGYNNTVNNCCAVVVGGYNNSNGGQASTILGGSTNTISGASNLAAILGGANNTINHNCSFIAGQSITTDKSNYFFVNNLDASGNIIGSTLSLTGLSAQNSEATAVMINGSNVVGTRELGSNAFNSTAFTSCTGTVTGVSSGNTNTITIGGTSTAPTVAANTAAVSNGGANLATGDQIYDHVTTRISGLTSCTGTSCLTLTGGVNNRIVTAGSTTSLIGESGLTYDGSTFFSNAQGNLFEGYISVGDDNAGFGCLILADDHHGGELGLQNTNECMIAIIPSENKFEYGSCGGPGSAAICVDISTACNYSIKLGKASTHVIQNSCSTIGGGLSNSICGNSACTSFIGGGYSNTICSAGLSNIVGGWTSTLSGSAMSTIVGGTVNTIKSVGGSGNFIGGGSTNQIWKATAAGVGAGCEINSSIVGGSSNAICNGLNGVSNSCGYSFIGGGLQNKMCYTAYNFLGGGCCNRMIGSLYSVLGGGCCNTLYNSYSFIGGGRSNISSKGCSVVVGGQYNCNDGILSYIGGGYTNCITQYTNCSSITAGYNNYISGCLHNSIGAGCQNCIIATTYGTANRIGGGQQNRICGTNVSYNTIPGGWFNIHCSTYCSTIGGGRSNCIKDQNLSTIGGGGSNYVCGRASTITGGENNCICNGAYGCASILGGCNNRICGAPYASTVGLANVVSHSCSHAIGAGLTSTSGSTTYMNNATVACHLQVGGTTTMNTTTGRIDATNDVVAFATSDRRLKENIQPINDALCKVIGVSGNTFDWKPLTEEETKTIHGNTGRDVGVIAQEIESILPEAVTTRDNGYKAVNYEKIVPLLIEAIKDQQKQIDELKSKA